MFLVLLLFSTYFKLSIVILNIFIYLILFKVILLTNFTCLRKRLILFISLHGSYLCSMLDTVIIFQSFRTILKISTSDVSFFTRILCISAIFNIIVLNFAKKTSFSSICRNVLILRQNLRILLLKPTMVCLLFVFWQLGFSITGFVINIFFTLTLELTFIAFIIYFILKLYIFINVFIQNLAKFFRNVLYILFRILSIFIFYCFVFFAIILLICILVNLLHVFRNIVNLFYILFSRSVSVNGNVDKDITHTVRLQSNTASVTFLFLMVLCKQKIDKKLKNFSSFLKVYDFFVS